MGVLILALVVVVFTLIISAMVRDAKSKPSKRSGGSVHNEDQKTENEKTGPNELKRKQ